MKCPANFDKLVQMVLKMRRKELVSEQLIMMAEGSNADWGRYLFGPRTQTIARGLNALLEPHDIQLVSEGIGTKRWLKVSCAEARWIRAKRNLARVDAHLRNSYTDIEAVYNDVRAPRHYRDEAKTWLDLFSNEESAINALIFREWADELLEAMPKLITEKQLTGTP